MAVNFYCIMRDIGELHGRLFNHHPFIQGEVKYMLKEFEEKRNDSEVQKMFEILENVTDTRETQIDKSMKLADMHLCNLTANLEVALRMCNNIVEKENSPKKTQILDAHRVNRKKEWMAFVDDIQNRNFLVNQTFDEKEEQIRLFYKKLEEAMC